MGCASTAKRCCGLLQAVAVDHTLLMREEEEGCAEPPSLRFPEGLSLGVMEAASPFQQQVAGAVYF